MPRIVVAGVVSVRLAHAVPSFPVPLISNQVRTGGLSVRLAGTGWTGATTLAALGTDLTFATYVGADGLGLFATQGLRERGWYGRATQIRAEQPRALTLYDPAGTRCGTSDLRSARESYYPADLFAALLDERPCDAAILSSVEFTRPLIQVAVERHVPIATDLHRVDNIDYPRKRDWLRAATILSCSHELLPHGPLAWIEALWARYANPIAIVGCGSDGAMIGIREDRAIWRVPASTPRGVRFVSGAGDTLLAAFVHRFVALGDPVSALRYAVLAAGWTIGGGPDDEFGLSSADLVQLGATHGLPAAHRIR